MVGQPSFKVILDQQFSRLYEAAVPDLGENAAEFGLGGCSPRAIGWA